MQYFLIYVLTLHNYNDIIMTSRKAWNKIVYLITEVIYMWFLINQNGERCKAVETEKEAIKECKNNSEYVSYVYSNNIFIM